MNVRNGKIFEEAMLTGTLKPCLVKSVEPLIKKEEVINDSIFNVATPNVEVTEPISSQILNEGTPSFIPNYAPPVAQQNAEPALPNFVNPIENPIESAPVYEQPTMPKEVNNVTFVPNNINVQDNPIESTPVYEESIVEPISNFVNAIDNPIESTPVYEQPTMPNEVNNVAFVPNNPNVENNPIVNTPVYEQPIIEPINNAEVENIVKPNTEITMDKVKSFFNDLKLVENYVNQLTEENEQLKKLIQEQNNTLHNVSTDFTNSTIQNQRLM